MILSVRYGVGQLGCLNKPAMLHALISLRTARRSTVEPKFRNHLLSVSQSQTLINGLGKEGCVCELNEGEFIDQYLSN